MLIFAVALCTVAWRISLPSPAPLKSKLTTVAEELVEEYNLPGITIAVANADGLTAIASGLADREAESVMVPKTTMLAASVGKTFVAATVLQLVDERRLDLDAPISDWLAGKVWFGRLPNANVITIRHLLRHTAGLPDHVYLPGFSDLWLAGKDGMTPEDSIELVLDNEPLFTAGAGWSYSDTGYLLIGLIIEQVTDQSYEDEVRARFLTPLGLTMTGPSDQQNLPGLARGYASGETGLGIPERTTDDDGALVWNPAIEWTGGGFYSTAHDLALWGRDFLSGRLLSASTYQEALGGVSSSTDDVNSLYGLGISIRLNSPWGPVYGHRGWISGYVSSVKYYPEIDTAIAFQTNTDIGIIDTDAPIILHIEDEIASTILDTAVVKKAAQRSSIN